MKRFIVKKADLHYLPKRKYLDAVKTMGSTQIINDTMNLDYGNLPFVAICLTAAEQKKFAAAGVQIIENTLRPATLGRFNGGGSYVPATGSYPFLDCGMDKNEQRNLTGRRVKIGMIDCGSNDFPPSIVIDFGINFTSGDASYADVHGHGGHIAAQVKSTIWGMAPGCIFHTIKCVDDSGFLSEANYLSGVSYAIAQGLDIVIMSFQLGSSFSFMQASIDSLTAAGILPVVAAGNSGPLITVALPAGCAGAVAVGSYAQGYTISSFTNLPSNPSGHGLSILAPGENVPYGGINGESRSSGTSFTTAYVAAAVACVMENNKLSSRKAWDIIRANALKGDPLYGAGFLMCP